MAVIYGFSIEEVSGDPGHTKIFKDNMKGIEYRNVFGRHMIEFF